MATRKVGPPLQTGYFATDMTPQGATVQLYYEVYGNEAMAGRLADPAVPKVLFIMGFAATGDCWMHQIAGFLGDQATEGGSSPLFCIFDNRGVGRSSSPHDKKLYSTEVMANDALALLDHLQWREFHLVGHSMGAMIGTKLAAMASRRVQSLTLISVSGGGWELIPRSFRAFLLGLQMFRAKTPEARAALDLQFHFTPKTLQTLVPGSGRRVQDMLMAEYVATARTNGPQSKEGQDGQAYACWTHRMAKSDAVAIISGGAPVVVVHGRRDLVAYYKYASRIAKRLGAQFLLLEGAHFITRECTAEVNSMLQSVISSSSSLNDRVGAVVAVQVAATQGLPLQVVVENDARGSKAK